ncbi:MAG TPA: response regulator [Parafilimonas sp.]|jgi:DNA-binding response OmpR family regulator
MSSTALQAKEPKKIFIVEDEGDMCLLLNIMLQQKEIKLDHAKTIAAAQDYLEKEHPSIIILDNKLPDGFGVNFLSFIKTNYPSTKIVMISGDASKAKDAALENGADVFLEKPFTRAKLYYSVKQLLN